MASSRVNTQAEKKRARPAVSNERCQEVQLSSSEPLALKGPASHRLGCPNGAWPLTLSRKPPKHHTSATALEASISERVGPQHFREACDLPILSPLCPHATATAKWRWTARHHGVSTLPERFLDLRRNPKILRCACDPSCVVGRGLVVQGSRM